MKYILSFLKNDKSVGLVLIGATLLSILFTNVFIGEAYINFWHQYVGGMNIEHWVNDGLMSIFFFLVGLELVREMKTGQLAHIKDATFPTFAAIGGMLIPAFLFLLFNFETPTQSGFGIPMATDIAFAIGFLMLLENRVPPSLKIFLTALAIIDDLGAIILIAVFYSQDFVVENLAISLAIFTVLILLNALRLKNMWVYLIGGVAMWYFMLQSGVHATITGVLLAFVIPFGKGDKSYPAYKIEHFLHYPVHYIILPIFALVNTAILIQGDFSQIITEDYSLGILIGLVFGKPIGILIFTFISVKIGMAKLPKGLNWTQIIGVGFLAGIGFTMSIFITLLAFKDVEIVNNAKLIILISSILAGGIGLFLLRLSLPQQKT